MALTNTQKYGLGILAVVVLLAIIFWKKIASALGLNGSDTPADGTACTTDLNVAGTYSNGVCVPNLGNPGPGGNGGGEPTDTTASRSGIPTTYRIPTIPGVQCQARINPNGHWYVWDRNNSTSTECVYTLIR